MELNETLKILSLIKIAYPNAYTKLSEDEIKAMSKLWYAQFKDYEFELVATATNTFISEDLSGYAPTIAQIKNICRKITAPIEKTDNEIWQPIQKAICNGIYESTKEWEKLPNDIQKCITPQQIRVWAMASTSELQWIKKEVVSEYRQQQQRQKEIDLLPVKAKELISYGND